MDDDAKAVIAHLDAMEARLSAQIGEVLWELLSALVPEAAPRNPMDNETFKAKVKEKLREMRVGPDVRRKP